MVPMLTRFLPLRNALLLSLIMVFVSWNCYATVSNVSQMLWLSLLTPVNAAFFPFVRSRWRPGADCVKGGVSGDVQSGQLDQHGPHHVDQWFRKVREVSAAQLPVVSSRRSLLDFPVNSVMPLLNAVFLTDEMSATVMHDIVEVSQSWCISP